ncbi:hypothetical protein QJS10_CPB15g02108 [Acorus calamus]|uniref:YTH domain-containing family protein n=1 Tax=Acorus calamus TaxID=4465 RepID=A0AAV9D603_ACOCL|nr:hypothetical protein QJS10_CPB15g02108 [Acorus calamus]
MAAVAPASEQASDLLQKLSLDQQTKKHDIVPEATKKYGSADGGDAPNAPIASRERSTTPLSHDFVDQSMCYYPSGYPYYYGGYDGHFNDWGEYMSPDGVEMPHGVYGDMYHGYGYGPYSPYPPAGSPVPGMGHDGQLYSPQHYQYQTSYYQPPTPNSSYTPNTTPQGDVSTSVAPNQATIPVDTTAKNSNGVANGTANGNNGTANQRQNHSQNNLLNSNGRGILPSNGYTDPRFGFDGMRSPWLDGPVYHDGQHRPATSSSISSAASHMGNARNQNLRPLPHLVNLHHPRPGSGMAPAPTYMDRMYPNNRMYGQYGNGIRSVPLYGSGYGFKTNGHWLAVDGKYNKPRGRGSGMYGIGNESLDGLNELNRGPRAGRFKNPKAFGPNITIAVKGQSLPSNGNTEESNPLPDREQYNREDFPIKYTDAKFFVIKSYSEDDVHKSVKYNVWASTQVGNKKLDGAYKEAQEKPGGCPIFLFFSVNTSGQFVGVAEMVGPVDFNKNVEHWQQDKWSGCFPVKWHIVKDVPNSILKHITLENNENKPVTNSRDTQDINLDQGLAMLKVFKEHVSKTSIVDDFSFYEARQKTMQEKRAKQQLQKQAFDGKPTEASVGEKDKDGVNTKPKPPITLLNKEAIQGLVERKPSEENGSVAAAVAASEAMKTTKPVTEKRVVANGVANGC